MISKVRWAYKSRFQHSLTDRHFNITKLKYLVILKSKGARGEVQVRKVKNKRTKEDGE